MAFIGLLGVIAANCPFFGAMLAGGGASAVYEQAPVTVTGTTDANGAAKGTFHFTPQGQPGAVTFVVVANGVKAAGTLQVARPGQAS